MLAAIVLGTASPAEASAPRVDPVARPHAADQSLHPVVAPQPADARFTPRPPIFRAPGNRLRREVFGFAPYWVLGTQDQWDLGLLTTIAYFGLDVGADGRLLTTTPGWSGWNSARLTALVARAHARGVRVVLTIKQFDEATINRIVTDPAATATAVDQVVAAIAARGLDGVNVDFEGHSDAAFPQIQAGTTRFMAGLWNRVHRRWPGAEMSLDTYTGSASWDGGIFKIGDLAPHVDAFFVMAYDMAASNMPGRAGPNAPLTGFTYNDTDAVAQYLTRAPASKVILGVPYFGYKSSTDGSGLYARQTGAQAPDSYADILEDYRCAGLQRSFDGRSGTPWTAWVSPSHGDPCGGNRGSWRQLYYDDAASLGLKYDLVNARGLRGAGMWALGYDGASRDLWNELAAKFAS